MIHVVRAEQLSSVSALKNKYGYKSPPGREKRRIYNLQIVLIFSLDETDCSCVFGLYIFSSTKIFIIVIYKILWLYILCHSQHFEAIL